MHSVECWYKPGTMAAIASAFAESGVSLKSVIQLGENDGVSSRITFLTHRASEFAVREALGTSSSSRVSMRWRA
ncbi:MAG: ACT domain-containing protein [Eubacteriales bacterium]